MDENIFAHMEFLGRAPQPEEKRVTREEFRMAVSAAVDKLVSDPKVEGMAKFLIPTIGITFACQMEEILFGKKEG
jgi:hypothetical protein